MEPIPTNEVWIILAIENHIETLDLPVRRENQGEKMKQYLAEERLGSDGEVTKKFRPLGEKRAAQGGWG